MDELEIMKSMSRSEYPNINPLAKPDDEITQRKHRQIAEIKKIGIIALCVVVVLIILYNLLVNPLDRIKFKMALFNSYIITVNIPGTSVEETIMVDGNIIYTDGTYYEVVNNTLYVYEQTSFGDWIKKRVSPTKNPTSNTWLISLLNKKNYTRNYLTGRMKYNRSYYFDGIRVKDFTAKVRFGTLMARGDISKTIDYGNYYLSISIGGFGLVRLNPPEVIEK